MMPRLKPLRLLLAGIVALALVPAGAAAQTTDELAPDQAWSGVAGKVGLIANPCPFYGCDPTPLRATIVAWQGDKPVRSTDTDGRGGYRLGLRPGSYVLTAHPWLRRVSEDRVAGIFCPPQRVHVSPGQVVRADFSCRTGLPA